MNTKIRKEFADQLMKLAAKLIDLNDLPASTKLVGLIASEKHFGLVGEDADTFDAMTGTLLQQSGWSEKYSEMFVGNHVRIILGDLYGDNNSVKAETLLEALDAEYQAYQKKHTVFVPLVGIVMHEPELKIGRVTIKKLLSEDIRRRPMMKDATQYFQHMPANLENATIAELSAVAEPVRAGEIGIEETRRAMDLLRYALPFIAPNRYKLLSMNVGIGGVVAQCEFMAVVLPLLDDNSISYNGVSLAVQPLEVNKLTTNILRECGAEDVAAILAKSVSSLSDFERVLLQGIHWFGNALIQSEPENELLSLVTCFDAFLTPRDSVSIGTAIADGVALFLGTTLDERKKLKTKVEVLCSKRSGLSHGGEKTVLESDLAQLREIAKRFIHCMISLNETIQTRKELLEMIEDQKVG